MTTLSTIVLRGGQSSCMGEDKALILIQSIPLLEKVCTVAKSCTDTIYIIVTPWTERYQHLHLSGCEFIQENSIKAQGGLVGLVQALEKVKTEWVLLLACDLPNLRIEVLQDWVNRLDNVTSLRFLSPSLFGFIIRFYQPRRTLILTVAKAISS